MGLMEKMNCINISLVLNVKNYEASLIWKFFCSNKPVRKCRNYIASQSISTESMDDPASVDILKGGKSTSQEDKSLEKHTAAPTQPQSRFYPQHPLHASQESQSQEQLLPADVEQESPSDSGKSTHVSIYHHHPHLDTVVCPPRCKQEYII